MTDPQHTTDSDSDDEPLTLSADTLSALSAFLSEKKEAEERFERLRAVAHDEADDAAEKASAQKREEELAKLSMADFGEDWQLSQFWYDEATAETLAKEALESTADGDWIACVSAPSAFVALKKMNIPNRRIVVLEFDRRFSVFSTDYVFYDFNTPTDLDERSCSRPLHHKFDFIIADPPFLSDECWSKTAETVRWLGKEGTKILVCTGQIMAKKVAEELGCKETTFDPKHKGGLANEFRCFANYDSKFGFRS
ncbi:EEF1A lysine methyltransferase 1 [Borealophlyctis nickersoniae]|nr:EEF1A lysine methyltransferase 1 [Borealophlyctis nickersoniae]